MGNDKLQLMKAKVKQLNEATKTYYQEDREIMSNFEYDKIYDELVALEKELGITMSNSPTINVGYELLSDLPKEAHEKPMLSLDKTKDPEILKEWLGEEKGLLSWKLDGLTIVLTYEQGVLVKAVTRGTGEIGEVITNNAKVFNNIPLNIDYKETLVLRGEAVISYSEFKNINSKIEDETLKYKNPRNLCSGSVRQLNNQITAERKVDFFAFSLVKANGIDFKNSRKEELLWLESLGFDLVEFKIVEGSNIDDSLQWFTDNIVKNDYPSDGLVLIYDDINYAESLGSTAKFPRDAIAFKWIDEIKQTQLVEIEWSLSRTGLINPVAIFKPVELEGTTVSRASLHNISIMENLELGIGDTIGVYKANMIIPQVAENLTKSNHIDIPKICPVCQGETAIKEDNGIKYLHCMNPDCAAKHIKGFSHFVGRDALNIENLSEATLEKLIKEKIITNFADIFNIEMHKEKIVKLEGFGERSFEKLVESINKSRKTTVSRLLYSLGIINIGKTTAKAIVKAFNNDWKLIEKATEEELIAIDGIGDVIAKAYVNFFNSEKNKQVVADLLQELTFEEKIVNQDALIFENINFVITGSLETFENRNALKDIIENKGGKVVSAVTSKTNYLINNDRLSNSSKNKRAKELNIKIITEEDMLKWLSDSIKP